MRTDETQAQQPQSPQRPMTVTRAVTLLYVSVVLGLLTAIGTTIWSAYRGALHVGGPLTVEILVWFVFLYFTYKIGQRANWARIVMLILIIITVIMKLISLGFVFSLSFFIGLLLLAIVVLQVIALCFLFSKPANAWFKS